MTEKTLTTENIKPALDALRGELAPWPVVAMKQDRLNDTQKSAVNSGITSSLVAQIIANTAAIRALESAITGTGLRALVVATLPAVGTLGILYIVPVTTYDPETDADVVNYSNEYLWIVAPDAPVTEGYYEQVGQTGIVINNGQLTITVNGTSVGTFTANQSGDTTAAITVPTNADYVDLSTNQTVAGVKTFSSTINGTASKAIADEDGTSIKTGYVNRTTNQSIAGQKTFFDNTFFPSPVYHKNTTYEIGTIPASNIVTNIYLADKNNVYTSFVRSVIYASGRTATEIRAKNAFKNGVLDPTGSDISSNLNVEVQPSGAKTIYWDGLIRNDVTPFTTNNNSLGSSTNQWSSVYSQTYYYNGTAWGLDKANTWTNTNTFQQNITYERTNFFHQVVNPCYILKDTELEKGSLAPVAHTAYPGLWQDKNGAVLGYMRFVEYDTGKQTAEIRVSNLLKNGALDPTGLTVNCTVNLELQPSGEKSLIPEQNNDINLGTSTNQWKSVYSQTYYYNGTQWGLDQANVWTQSQTISINLPAFTLQDIYGERDKTPGNTRQLSIYFCDKNGAIYSFINRQHRATTGTHLLQANVENGTYDYRLQFYLYTNGGSDFMPSNDGVINLGKSSNKWKTLNGVNPGALSLPINANSASFNIDITNWTTDGSIIGYTPLLDGWIYINARNDDTNGDSFIIFDDGVSGFGTSVFGNKGLQNNGIGLLCLMMPVNKNNGINIRIKSPGIISARLYPCNGNV